MGLQSENWLEIQICDLIRFLCILLQAFTASFPFDYRPFFYLLFMAGKKEGNLKHIESYLQTSCIRVFVTNGCRDSSEDDRLFAFANSESSPRERTYLRFRFRFEVFSCRFTNFLLFTKSILSLLPAQNLLLHFISSEVCLSE
ncbi:hypothetical protein AVEN_171055-1 [Araneus ventricosus]|uniref:Uncharacterized protein n=1 Tax=Araneus ventricosus TaxID=182803 RepID=A0A4Y2LMP7_ARAVE|nr:hypothetical protein AVEN_171055-1 [Araneus ventricosus]